MVEALADLAGGLVLSVLVGVCCRLTEEKDEQKRYAKRQYPGGAPCRFSRNCHTSFHPALVIPWTQLTRLCKQSPTSIFGHFIMNL
jgi:hypothetical protein